MELSTFADLKQTKGRILSVDFGDTRPGLAVSDISRFLASGIGYVSPGGIEKTANKVAEVALEQRVGGIVVGLPKNMDGTEGSRAQLCREFADKLREATGLPVAMWDERRTTVEAHNILSQHNYHGKKRKNTVDAVAASLILEGYLAFKKR